MKKSNLWISIPVFGLLIWFVLYPNLYVLFQSFVKSGHLSLENYKVFFSSSSQIESLSNSLLISIGSVLISATIGIPLAFIFNRFDFPGRRLFASLASLPVLLPPLVGVMAFLFLYGESGLFTRGLQWLLQLRNPPFSLEGVPAILLVHGYTMYVYFYLFVSSALKRMDESLKEASLSLGASSLQTLRWVTLPMLTPAILGASLLTFMTSMASFSAPYIFGGGIRVLALQIYNSKLNGDLEMAMVETVVLTTSSILFLFLLQKYEATDKYRSVNKGVSPNILILKSKTQRTLVACLGISLVTLLLLPHITLILISFSQDGTWTTQILPPDYTFENYQRLFNDSDFLKPISNSLKMAIIATIANILFALAAGWLLIQKKLKGRLGLSILTVLPWALPGTVIALNLATTFGKNDLLEGRILLVGTFWILPLAYFIRHIPLVVRAIQAGLEQLNPEFHDAARSLGASWLFTLRRILLPLLLPSIVAGGMLAFVTALGEFVSSIVIYTIDNRPISVEILSQIRQFNFGSAAAYGVLLIIMIALVFFTFSRYMDQNKRTIAY
ncbi:MAG: iron ABC transporter permease [Acidobacteriia bacterium]|nr:iron ABC transporter permease [Terriglobia bacterium]